MIPAAQDESGFRVQLHDLLNTELEALSCHEFGLNVDIGHVDEPETRPLAILP